MQAVQQVEHHDRDRELVAGLGRQHRGVAPLGVPGDQGALRRGHHQLAAAPYRFGHGTGGRLVASLGREHHDEVEAAGPAGEPGSGPGDERHRADRLEHGPQQPRVRAGGHHGPGPDLGDPLDGLGQGLGGRDRLAPYPRTGLGQGPQAYVGAGQGDLVVEETVVERHG